MPATTGALTRWSEPSSSRTNEEKSSLVIPEPVRALLCQYSVPDQSLSMNCLTFVAFLPAARRFLVPPGLVIAVAQASIYHIPEQKLDPSRSTSNAIHESYPVTPEGLDLEQVLIYVRHGERTPVRVRMSDPPASIPADSYRR
ncbi:hypothetical protein C8R48DRAFT_778622 [Suillus tomentosus]|nr:hypothetical protein C8R48DRAFT_778622 [Suillus tomentosus]